MTVEIAKPIRIEELQARRAIRQHPELLLYVWAALQIPGLRWLLRRLAA